MCAPQRESICDRLQGFIHAQNLNCNDHSCEGRSDSKFKR